MRGCCAFVVARVEVSHRQTAYKVIGCFQYGLIAPENTAEHTVRQNLSVRSKSSCRVPMQHDITVAVQNVNAKKHGLSFSPPPSAHYTLLTLNMRSVHVARFGIRIAQSHTRIVMWSCVLV